MKARGPIPESHFFQDVSACNAQSIQPVPPIEFKTVANHLGLDGDRVPAKPVSAVTQTQDLCCAAHSWASRAWRLARFATLSAKSSQRSAKATRWALSAGMVTRW